MRVITGTARGRRLKTPEGMDIRPMESLGKKFDPQYHEAVDHAEQEGAESDDIIEVVREGFFRLADGSVIRHAMVRVAK